MQNPIFRYGLIGGVVIVLLMSISFLLQGDSMDFEYGELKGYTTMVLALSSIYFGVKQYRDRQQEGKITFGQGFRVGISIALIVSAFYVIGWLIISSTIAADFGEQYIAHYTQELASSGLSEAELKAKIDEVRSIMEKYDNNLAYKIGVTFLEIFPIDLIVSLITALVLRKK